ncbi:NADPH-dependent F420 reductase [Demequina lignilytica]|uniref:NADP oxidoreductase n=1 Tax=Demequina lignilytica TaxID=3051663 RepID=A0AB35MFB9_9MICO|nr:NADP oxidoreductase [Demequina sp. SYSU T0a273]MDN4482449.1 NADP oxidoreductase [Demequina sp. SYSU T0a273]
MAPRVGILGRGRFGGVIAGLCVRAGLEVDSTGSGDADALARVATADIVILALPLGRLETVPPHALAGALVVDATNHWWELDGARPDLEDPRTSTSESVQRWLAESRVVKAFGHASAWELENLGRLAGDPARRALAIAGDHPDDVARVGALVDALGFDPVPIGPLAAGAMVEPGTETFGADVGAEELREIIARFPRSQRGRVIARARGVDPSRLPALW